MNKNETLYDTCLDNLMTLLAINLNFNIYVNDILFCHLFISSVSLKMASRLNAKLCLMAIFCLIVCFSGSGYHIYHISSQYFSYEINTNVRLVTNKEIKPPSP